MNTVNTGNVVSRIHAAPRLNTINTCYAHDVLWLMFNVPYYTHPYSGILECTMRIHCAYSYLRYMVETRSSKAVLRILRIAMSDLQFLHPYTALTTTVPVLQDQDLDILDFGDVAVWYRVHWKVL